MGAEMASLTLYKVVFELRYDFGYTFWDRGGAAVNELLRYNKDFVVVSAGEKRTTLIDRANELNFAFGPLKLDVSQQLTRGDVQLLPVEDFAKISGSLTNTVVDCLSVEQFSRIGFRTWQLLETPSLEEAQERLKASGFADLSFIERIKGVEGVDEANCSFVVSRETNSTRIAMAAVEQKVEVPEDIKKVAQTVPHKRPVGQPDALRMKIRADKQMQQFPQFAVLINMDHYVHGHPTFSGSAQEVEEFITSNHKWGSEAANSIAERLQIK